MTVDATGPLSDDKTGRTYPVIKTDRDNGQTVVTGKTLYGKVTATFAADGRDSVVWTNKKDVVVNQCVVVENEKPKAVDPSRVGQQLS
jgi:hypothetical protein